jgi:hypothetical protein
MSTPITTILGPPEPLRSPREGEGKAMAKEAFIEWEPSGSSLVKLAKMVVIINEFQAKGFTMTLRQAYYQMVARGFIPNSQREYKNLGNLLNKARLAGLVDWNAIEDRTRSLRGTSTWEKPADVVRSAHYSFHIDLWKRQPYRVEVWVEKEALASVVQRTASRNQCDFFACKGYGSQSEYYVAAQRLRQYKELDGQWPVIIHLGDHDPSGIDMTRDIIDRLRLMSGGKIQIQRIALNMDQVRRYSPPPNPAKLTDSRVGGYMVKFGNQSWELDALPPDTLDTLIQGEINNWKDDDLWDEDVAREKDLKKTLKAISDNYSAVMDFLHQEELVDTDVDVDDVPTGPAFRADELDQEDEEDEDEGSDEDDDDEDDDEDEEED